MSLLFALFTLTFAASNSKCSSAYCSACDAADPAKCTGCIDNYVLANGVCVYCTEADAHCKKAKNGKCTDCFAGYHILANGVCEEDDVNCDEYKNGNCVECEDGYTLQAGKCVKCNIAGCEECDHGVDTCDECIDGYLLIKGECVQPVANCEEYIDGTQKCEECMDGYRLEQGECVKIPVDNCRKMQNGVCVKCFGPYLPVNGVCTAQASEAVTIEHCAEYDEDGEFECEECEPGYYTNEQETQCLKCDASCKTCDDRATECESCSEGYYVQNDKCVKCDVQSDVCEDFKTENKCYQCNHKCNWFNNKCVDAHCLLFEEDEEDAKCVKCEDGYVLSDNEMICIQSADGCKTKNGEICVECAKGYFMKEDFTCGKCDSKCKTCAHSATQCLSCFNDGTIKTETDCSPCEDQENCLACPLAASQCVQCRGNYTAVDGVCEQGCYRENCDGSCSMCSDRENNMDIVYPPTDKGVCLKYSQMPNNPKNGVAGIMMGLILMLALLF